MRYFINKRTGNMIQVNDNDTEKIKKFEEDENYEQHFALSC